MPTVSLSEETAVRARILDAAFAAFMKHGYAATSTLEIATRARVSKRELYATVGNKQEMLIACISQRAARPRNVGPRAGVVRDAAWARDQPPRRHRGVSFGDRRGGPRARGGAGA